MSGTVYRLASAGIALTHTILHVGDPTTDTLTVSNTDAADGYSESLIASVTGTDGGFSQAASGPTADIAAGATNTALSVGLSTAQSGTVTGSVTLGLVSDGSGIDGFGTLALPSQTIAVSGTIDNYATAQVIEVSGTPVLTGSGTTYSLNLGQVALGATPVAVVLGVKNAASAVADALNGDFASSGGSEIALSGFSAFTGLAAGEAQDGLDIALNTGTAGMFTQSITLFGTGSNARLLRDLAPETITVTGTVAAPPPTLNTPGPITLANQRLKSRHKARAVVHQQRDATRARPWMSASPASPARPPRADRSASLAAGATDDSDIWSGSQYRRRRRASPAPSCWTRTATARASTTTERPRSAPRP